MAQKKANRWGLAFKVLVGWRLSKDALKLPWMLGFVFWKLISHPHLYPQFAVDTPVEEYLSQRVEEI